MDVTHFMCSINILSDIDKSISGTVNSKNDVTNITFVGIKYCNYIYNLLIIKLVL